MCGLVGVLWKCKVGNNNDTNNSNNNNNHNNNSNHSSNNCNNSIKKVTIRIAIMVTIIVKKENSNKRNNSNNSTIIVILMIHPSILQSPSQDARVASAQCSCRPKLGFGVPYFNTFFLKEPLLLLILLLLLLLLPLLLTCKFILYLPGYLRAQEGFWRLSLGHAGRIFGKTCARRTSLSLVTAHAASAVLV